MSPYVNSFGSAPDHAMVPHPVIGGSDGACNRAGRRSRTSFRPAGRRWRLGWVRYRARSALLVCDLFPVTETEGPCTGGNPKQRSLDLGPVDSHPANRPV